MMKLVCLTVLFGLLAVSIAQVPVAIPPHTSLEVPIGKFEVPPVADAPRSRESETPEIQRNFNFGFSSNQIDAHIQLRSNGTEHELRHQIGAAATGAEFVVEFNQTLNDTKPLRMRLRLFELIEYIPDSTPGYQNETVVNSYRNWNWGKGLVDITPSSNDSKIYTCKTFDKIFGLVIRINKPENGTLTINPEDVKFDIEFDVEALRAAGWLNGTEVALKVALVTRFDSEKQHNDDSKQTENAINVGSNVNSTTSASLSFTWVNYIQCDTNTVSVVSSSLSQDNTQVDSDDDANSTAHVVAFAFINLKDQANSTCVWDPVVGASAADTTSTSSSSPSSTTTTTTASSDAASVVASMTVVFAAFASLF